MGELTNERTSDIQTIVPSFDITIVKEGELERDYGKRKNSSKTPKVD